MDRLTKKQRSELMSRIKSKKTGPELFVHSILEENKIRHEMNPRMAGNPDVVIPEIKSVIFVNGCFWHGCKKHFRLPKTNMGFWKSKIDRNIVRQKESIRELRELGYKSFVIWEHDLR